MNDPTTISRLYGRLAGHALRVGQAPLFERLMPEVEVPASRPLDAATLLGDDRPLELEIGFGSGEHLAGQTTVRPDHGFIGCEPFLNGVVGALAHLDERRLKNVHLHMGDALEVLERLPETSLDRVYLLHPDPWPKARHAKRRFMDKGPIDLIARKLKPGGLFHFGTDHPIYCRWAMMVMVMGRRDDFEWLAKTPQDFRVRPED